MKRAIPLILIAALAAMLMAGCTPYHAQGITAGALVGGIAGAVIDHREPARGALIGGTLGGVVGGTLADINYRSARDPYDYGRPGDYRTYDGRRTYTPETYYYSYPRYR